MNQPPASRNEIAAIRAEMVAAVDRKKAAQSAQDRKAFGLPVFPVGDADGFVEWAVQSGAPMVNRTYKIRRK